MELRRLCPASLLVTVAGLVFGSFTVVAVESTRVYELCGPSISGFPRPGPIVVSVSPASPPFTIRSPNSGVGNYSGDLDCSLLLRSGAEPLVLLFFYIHFDVEVELACDYDFLCVNGIKYCGNWEAGFVFPNILPAYSVFTIAFRTDTTVHKRGFEITVIPQPVVNDQTVTEAKGRGSVDRLIQFEPVTYTPGLSYIDGCSLL